MLSWSHGSLFTKPFYLILLITSFLYRLNQHLVCGFFVVVVVVDNFFFCFKSTVLKVERVKKRPLASGFAVVSALN